MNCTVYDAFIVNAAADEPFIRGYLLPRLALPADRVLRIQTLELARFITDEIERGVRSSRVTLVVLSSAYMDDRWAMFGEQLAAYASVARHCHGVLLPLLLEDCKLPVHVQSLVTLDFRDPARDVWDAQIDRLRAYLGLPAAVEPELPCPYPGMRSFTEHDAARFFGREAELDRIVRRLRHGEREIFIIGASGSGKSSLIAAGLAPRLARGGHGLPQVHVRTLRPGDQPLDQLAAALEGDVAAPNTAVGALLARHAPASFLVLVIDQLEELFAIAGEDERRGFLAALRGLRTDARCVLVFALRADFYGALMDSSLWTDREGRISRVDLGPLRRDDLRMVIERPARALDVYFQPELVSKLIDDAAREPGALPLLQETLCQLWSKRRQRLLALADYEGLGDGMQTGLAFAVTEHADDVLRTLTAAQKVIALRILLRLVNFGDGRPDTRRQQPRDRLRSEGETAADFGAVLQRLVDNRLVTVTGDDRGGEVRVDLAHEILIHAWTTFADWIRVWRAYEQRRRELEAAAAAWRVRGGGEGGLLDPVELAGALAWRDKAAQELSHTSDLAAFMMASEVARADATRREWQQREERNRLLAESSRLCQETGRQRLIDAERPLEALPYLVAARQATEASGSSPDLSLRMLFAGAAQNLPLSDPLKHRGAVASAAFSPDGARVVTASHDQTARIWDAATGDPVSPPLEHHGTVVSAAFSPDGTRVITASADMSARVWDVASGALALPPLEHRSFVVCAAFSPDGGQIVTASGDRTAQIWSAATGEPLSRPLEHRDTVIKASFSPDGGRVVTASMDWTAQIWDVATGEALSRPLRHRGSIASAVFSPDGGRVVTASGDGTARIWDTASGKPVSRPLTHDGVVLGAVFSPDGSCVVTASSDHAARIWDATSGTLMAEPLEHQGVVMTAVFSPNGACVVTASGDQTARIWDAATGKPLSPALEHQGIVMTAAFSPDGTRVVTASGDQTARVWNAIAGLSSLPLPHRSTVGSAAFSPDGLHVVTASGDRTARIWDAATGEPTSRPLPHRDTVVSAAFSHDGAHVVTASSDGTAQVWSVATGARISPPLRHADTVMSAAFSPDGTRVVTASTDHTAWIWEVATGTPVSSPLRHHAFVMSAAFSPDGTRIVTASGDQSARIWDAVTGEPVSLPLQHHGSVMRAVFSPDGGRIVTASGDFAARIWDASSGKRLPLALEHQGIVITATFSPDGTRVLTASWDRTARIWDAATGRPLSPPLTHHGSVMSAAFSPDGMRVVTASLDQTARIWDASTGKALSPPLAHRGAVLSAAFSPDGMRIVTASEDQTARIWDLPVAAGALGDWLAIATHASPYVVASGVLSPRFPIHDQS
jgi:WD40 repeat protein